MPKKKLNDNLPTRSPYLTRKNNNNFSCTHEDMYTMVCGRYI